MRIDHVIYATRDLEGAVGRIERELGLASLPGGRHEGLGTHNRIVPLGAAISSYWGSQTNRRPRLPTSGADC